MKKDIDALVTPDVSAAQSSDGLKFKFNHILAPTDFSPNSERAIEYALQLAQRLGAKLTLLHVIPEPSALDYSMEGISVEQIQEWEKEAEIRLTEERRRAQLKYKEVDVLRVLALHPRDEIVREASDLAADLLVISTHGYTGWKHFLFGSDAENILQHAPCPVLVVR